jgi:hypothetical protein
MPDDDRQANPERFRTETFQSFWSWTELQLQESAKQRLDGLHRHASELGRVLWMECDRWVELGAEIGYFDDDNELQRDILNRSAAEFFATTSASNNLFKFQAEVSVAQETLTPAHFRMLELIHYADQAEWDDEVEVLDRFAVQLGRQPRWQPAPTMLGTVEWGLLDLDLDTQSNPSSWRLDGLATHQFGPEPELARERVETLRRLRDAVSAAVAWAVNLEAEAEGMPLVVGIPRIAEEPEKGPDG